MNSGNLVSGQYQLNDGGESVNYFAYGSNMDSKRMKERGIYFSQRERGFLNGYSLKFNKQASANPAEGKANIMPNKEGLVEGIIFEISQPDLSKLNQFEGYPDHYMQKMVTVKNGNGTNIDCLTYIAKSDKVKDGLLPTKEYINHLLAAKDILLEAYYEKLKSLKTLD